ncbi:MAG: hypothetical protein RL095_191 [Verrucomicrobiota bacterium]|jgi:hypothetical protein
MKFPLLCSSLLALGLSLSAADKTYQKTGPVVEITDSKIVLETKDDGKWEFSRSAVTKADGSAIKVGDKVTVTYTMTATAIEVKGDKKAEKSGDKKAEKAEKK